jgi:hypothetical protein
MSCLDRIYASATRTHSLSRWEHEHTTIPSDHKMVSMLFAPLQAPHIGKGRWTWPLGLLNDDKLTLKIAELRINLQREIPSLPGDHSMGNIQRLWEDFKQNICREAKASAKVQLANIQTGSRPSRTTSPRRTTAHASMCKMNPVPTLLASKEN